MSDKLWVVRAPPAPETLDDLCGLSREILEALIKRAVHDPDNEPNKSAYQIYKAVVGGVAYQVEYGRFYTIRGTGWHLTFNASNNWPQGYAFMQAQTISGLRHLYNPQLHGDAERFKHDVTLIKLFLQ